MLIEKDKSLQRLRDENARLVTDLDRSITKQKEMQEAAAKTEAELRQQVDFYRQKAMQEQVAPPKTL